MSRDSYERRDDGYDPGSGRRGRRAMRADEQWPPQSDADSYPAPGGSHRRSGDYPDAGSEAGYTDPGYDGRGYTDPGHRDRGYGGGDPGSGYGASGYPYSNPGHAGGGYSGQPDGYGEADGYGQSGGYGRPAGYQDGGYPAPGYGNSGEHYRDGGYGAPDPYRAGVDGYDTGGYDTGSYGGRAGFAEQDPYGGPGGYETGDPYAGQDSRGRRGASQPGYDSRGGPQFGGGYDDRDFGAPAPDRRDEYLERAPDYGRSADRGAYGWRDPVEDSGVRRRQRDPEDDFDPDSARHNGFFRGFGAPDDAVGHRPPKKRKRGGAGTIALLILIIFLGGVIGGGYYAYNWYSKRHADWQGSGYGAVVVRVMPGEIACSGAMENTMVSAGVVASASAFCNAAKANATGRVLEPGYFRLHKHMSATLAWALLLDPKSRVNKTVAVPDGLRVSKVIAILAAKTGLPASQFQSALNNTSALGLPAWAKGNPEGFLWPATYNLQPGTSALSILQMLVKQSETEYSSINLAAKAKTAGFTEYQVIIEASLLEAEVPPQYYTRVAKVIDNRLNQVPQWDLGLDSTVAYALNKYVYNLSVSDLNVNSPYNTTKHPGLPPGPIDSPDLQAIQAVLHPAATSALYFVTINKQGLTEFTSDPNQFQIWSNEAKHNGI